MASSRNTSETRDGRRRTAVMADVAKLAGVSHQTVSRVINDSAHGRPETRRRVLAAMRQLDYRPNPAARALVPGRSRTVGVVSFDTTLYGPASTLFAIEQAAHAAGYFITIVSLPALDRASVMGAIERLRVQGVDGILVISPQEGAAEALVNLPADMPLVAVEAGPAGSGPAVARRPAGGGAGRLGARRRRPPVRRRRERDAPPARPRPSRRASHRRAAGLAGGARARRGLALGAGRGGGRGAPRADRRLEPPLRLPARPATRRGAGRHGGLRRERPDGARAAARAARARPRDPGRHQRRRLRRHPRGAVLHTAADDRAPGLLRDGPQRAADAARRDAELRSAVGAPDGRPGARRSAQHGAAAVAVATRAPNVRLDHRSLGAGVTTGAIGTIGVGGGGGGGGGQLSSLY